MPMPVEDTTGRPRGPLYDLLRLQTDFQEKLAATTLAYLRQLQGLIGPVVPGTMVDTRGVEGLAAAGDPGTRVTLEVAVENRQRAHCLVTPMLSPLASKTTTWLPRADAPARLLAPDAVERIALSVKIPKEISPGLYRGELILYGLREGAVPVRIEVRQPPAPAPESPPAAGRPGRSRGKGAIGAA
jgi:hypothetical protein